MTRNYKAVDYQCLADFFACVDQKAIQGGYPVTGCPVPKCVTQFTADCEANL